ncbi:hypothetical protein ZIOFF_032205 [Zingiber officinale]|uniref:Glucan endo-1,3-beta-D-glucosidase n=1 Tax=Zingiber officinale TaxID=94328 RepID=A0A8J5L5I7_ZINOF|nr:hypothetical protein ZIOFF_032205 [Zingiber officinale]
MASFALLHSSPPPFSSLRHGTMNLPRVLISLHGGSSSGGLCRGSPNSRTTRSKEIGLYIDAVWRDAHCCSPLSGTIFLFFLRNSIVAYEKTELVIIAEAQGTIVRVNYGMLGDNLSSPAQVVSLFESRGIGRLRLFHPDAAALAALRSSGIEVVLGTLNEELPGLAAGTPSPRSPRLRANKNLFCFASSRLRVNQNYNPTRLASHRAALC